MKTLAEQNERLTTLRSKYSAIMGNPIHKRNATELQRIKSDSLAVAKQIQNSRDVDEAGEAAIETALQLSETASFALNDVKTAAIRSGKGGGSRAAVPHSSAFHGEFLGDPAAGELETLEAWAGDGDTGGFDSFGGFLKSIANARRGNGYDPRLESFDLTQTDVLAAYGAKSTDAHGGFLVPERFRRELLLTAEEDTPWLMRRTNIDPDGGNATFPVLEDRNRQDGIAGTVLQRVAENQKIPGNFPKISSTRMELTKAGALASVSNELLVDSAGMADGVVRTVFASAVAQLRASNFVGGTGVGEPMGVIESPMTYVVAKEDNQGEDTVLGANILKMRQRAMTYDRMVWLAHPSTYEQLAMARIAGDNSDLWIFQPARGEDIPSTLLGREIYFHESASLLGEKGDVILFDPRAYLYSSGPVIIDTSGHVAFDEYRTVYRVVLRDAGHPWSNETQKDIHGYERSEFVTLAERA